MASATLATALYRGTSLRTMAAVLAGVLALTVSARISIPLGEVPFSLQTLAVVLIGCWMGPVLGSATVAAYIAAGLAGLPLFTMGGGPGYVLSPTFGYLMGFVPSAYLAGYLTRRGWTDRALPALAAMLLATGVVFAFGLAWLAMFVPPHLLAATGLIPFVPGAVFKSALAALAVSYRRG